MWEFVAGFGFGWHNLVGLDMLLEGHDRADSNP